MTLTRLTSNREVVRDRDAAQGSDVAWGSDMAQGSDVAQGRDTAQGSGDVVWCLEIQVSKGKTTKKKTLHLEVDNAADAGATRRECKVAGWVTLGREIQQEKKKQCK